MFRNPDFVINPFLRFANVLGFLSVSALAPAQPTMLTPLPIGAVQSEPVDERLVPDGSLAAIGLDGERRYGVIVGVREGWGGRLLVHRASATLASSAFSSQIAPPFELPTDGNGEYHIPLAPDFMVSGDLDGDQRSDLLVGERGAEEVLLLPGGVGTGVASPLRASLPGRLDYLVSVTVADGPVVILAWQSSAGAKLTAIRRWEEIILPRVRVPLPDGVVDMAMRSSPSGDLAIAALTRDTVVELRMHLRNDELTIAGALIEHQLLQPACAIAYDTASKLIILGEDGKLYSMLPSPRGRILEAMFRVHQGPLPVAARLRIAGVAGRGSDELLVNVPESGTTIWTEDGTLLGTLPAGPVLAARLNGDRIDDLLVLTKGSSIPRVYASVPCRVFPINSLGDDSDALPGDMRCADLSGSCTLRAAIEEANASPGLDAAVLTLPGSEPHRILLQSPLPEIEEALNLDLTGARLEAIETGVQERPLLRSRPVRTTQLGIGPATSQAGTWPAGDERPLRTSSSHIVAASIDRSDWQWLNPLPQGENLNAVWGTGVGKVWAVGNRGAAVRLKNGVWERVPSTIENHLTSLSGTMLNDIFFGAGNYDLGGETFHWDGSSWNDLPDDAINREVSGIWAAASNDVWAVTERGTGGGETWHWDGSSWTYVPPPAIRCLYGVWGAASDDVFAVGELGTVFHWGGAAWSTMITNTDALLNSVWGSHGGNVYAVGNYGTILHYDGAWTAEDSQTTKHLHAVWVGSGVTYAVGESGTILRRTGSGWEAMSTPTYHHLYGVWGSLADDVYAVGEDGLILHYDGNLDLAWTIQTRGTLADLADLCDDGRRAIAVGANGTIATFNGSTWEVEDRWLTPSDIELHDISPGADGNMWVVGSAGAVWHGQGNRWTKLDAETSQDLHGVWGRGNEAWVVGNGGTILSIDTAGNVTPMDAGTTEDLDGIWGWTTEAFAFGWDFVLRYVYGVGWVDTGFPTVGVAGIWGTGPSNVYVTTGGIYIYRYDGSAWTYETAPPGDYRGIWGTGPGDIYAVGDLGDAAHFNGSDWTSETLPTTRHLAAVAAGGSGEIFAVGGSMTICRRAPNGAWSQDAVRAFADDLQAVALSSGATLYAVGEGTIMVLDQGEWKAAATAVPEPSYYGDFDAVSCAPGQSEVWATGRTGYYRHNGLTWERQNKTGASAGGTAVFAPQPDAVFVGGSNDISFWDGQQWQDMDTAGSTWDIYDIWGTSSTDVWAVGRFGTILHYDGNPQLLWSVHSSGTTADLKAVRGTPIGLLAVGGEAALRYDGGQWLPIDVGAVSHTAIAANGSDTYILGASYSAGGLYHHTSQGWETFDLLSVSGGPLRAISLNQWGDLLLAGDGGKILGTSPSGLFYSIFADGFESGDLTRWSTSVPQ